MVDPTFVSVCKLELQRAIQLEWPGLEVRIDLRPCLDLSLGDFFSDVSRQIAEQLKEPTTSIAKKIFGLLKSDSDTRFWSIAGDYLNLRVKGQVNLELNDLGRTAPEISIIVPGRSREISWVGYLRVIGHAALQLAMVQSIGGRGSICEVGVSSKVSGAKDWLEFFRSAAFEALNESEYAFSLSELKPRLEGQGFKTLWLYPDCIPRSDFAGLFLVGNRCKAITVERVKLAGLDTHFLTPARVESMADAELAALILLLCSPQAGPELDLNAAVLRDRENLPWFIKSLQERMLGILPQEIRKVPIVLENCSSEESELVRRGLQVGGFIEAGALEGRVDSWVSASRDLMIRVARWLNHPTLRILANSGNLHPHTSSILTGVSELFSAIISQCRPFRGQEPAQQ